MEYLGVEGQSYRYLLKYAYLNFLLYISSNIGASFVLFSIDNSWLYLLSYYALVHGRDTACVCCLTLANMRRWWKGRVANLPPPPPPPPPTVLAVIIPCYREEDEAMKKTLQSLFTQQIPPNFKLLPMLILDGLPKPKLLEFLAAKYIYRFNYKSWKQNNLSIAVYFSLRHGILILEKSENNGKKCSLILGHQILFDIFFNSDFLPQIAVAKIAEFVRLPDLSYILNTDCNTTFSPSCLQALLANLEQRQNNVTCGFVKVRFTETAANFWSNLQNYQYYHDQKIRRAAESLCANVVCLPGVCSMIKVDKHSTWLQNGLQRFSRLPVNGQFFQTISTMLGTDRKATAVLLKCGYKPTHSQNAIAFTSCPQNMRDFMRQRKRWTSNAYANSCLLVSANVSTFTKVNAVLDAMRIVLTPFRACAVAGFILSLRHFSSLQLALISGLIMPKELYMFVSVCSEASNKINLVIGWLLNKAANPILSTVVVTKMMASILDFRW